MLASYNISVNLVLCFFLQCWTRRFCQRVRYLPWTLFNPYHSHKEISSICPMTPHSVHATPSFDPLSSSSLGKLISTRGNLGVFGIGHWLITPQTWSSLTSLEVSFPLGISSLGCGSPEHSHFLYISKNKTKSIREMLFQGVTILPTKKTHCLVFWEQLHIIKYILGAGFLRVFFVCLFFVIFLKMRNLNR